MNCQYDFICYTSVVLGCGCRCHGLQMGSLIFRGQLGPESSRKGQQPRATPQSQSWVRQAGGVRGHGQPLGSMLRKVLGLQLLLEGARGRGRWREGGGSERGGKKDEGSVRDKREQHRGRDGSGVKKQIARGNEESMRRRREREMRGKGERERKTNNTVKSWMCTTAKEAVTKGMHSWPIPSVLGAQKLLALVSTCSNGWVGEQHCYSVH